MTSSPLYQQSAEALRTRLAQSEWKEGDRLPSESELCEEFGVSTVTMRRAVATLVAEGLLIRLQGKGTFVSSDHAILQGPPQLTSFTQDLHMRGWRSTARLLSLNMERAPGHVTTKLGLAAGALVHVLRRVRLADERPVAIQTAYVPALLFPGLEAYDFTRASLYEIFQRDYGVKPANASDVYRVGKVTAEEAGLLEVETDSPAFRVARLTSDSTGRRIEMVENVIRGDRWAVVLRLTASRQPAR